VGRNGIFLKKISSHLNISYPAGLPAAKIKNLRQTFNSKLKKGLPFFAEQPFFRYIAF
jgi:hypothetical protein